MNRRRIGEPKVEQFLVAEIVEGLVERLGQGGGHFVDTFEVRTLGVVLVGLVFGDRQRVNAALVGDLNHGQGPLEGVLIRGLARFGQHGRHLTVLDRPDQIADGKVIRPQRLRLENLPGVVSALAEFERALADLNHNA